MTRNQRLKLAITFNFKIFSYYIIDCIIEGLKSQADCTINYSHFSWDAEAWKIIFLS